MSRIKKLGLHWSTLLHPLHPIDIRQLLSSVSLTATVSRLLNYKQCVVAKTPSRLPYGGACSYPGGWGAKPGCAGGYPGCGMNPGGGG